MPSSRRSLSKANFFLVRALAAIGFCISGYLFLLKLAGKIDSLAGCGGDDGCANVLGSKWSAWLHIPVSALAAAFYILVIVLSFNRARSLLIAAALTLIFAALWFTGLMIFVIDSFCPWCLAIHITGTLTAIAIFVTTRRTQPVSWGASAVLALAPLLVLAGGQIWGPEPATHAIADDEHKANNAPIHQRGEGRVITFGPKSFVLSDLPFIGPPDADHVFVKYFDYTCGSCRNMEEDLIQLMEKHPTKFAVILLPTPLNRKCNTHMRSGVKDHPWACELAKLGMAAWRAQPESFPKIHKILFSRPILSVQEARRKIIEIIPEDTFNEALKDPWVNELIAANIADYHSLTSRSIKMPKLLIVDTKVFQGVARSSEIFVQEIEKVFGY